MTEATTAPAVAERRPALTQLLARFVAVGGLSVGSDVIVLFVLHSLAHVQLLAATIVGYAVSLVINYTLNHGWVFEASGDHHKRLVRYFTLVAFNVVSTLGFVEGLTSAGLHYLLAKCVAVAVNAVVNFTGFRFWVFR